MNKMSIKEPWPENEYVIWQYSSTILLLLAVSAKILNWTESKNTHLTKIRKHLSTIPNFTNDVYIILYFISTALTAIKAKQEFMNLWTESTLIIVQWMKWHKQFSSQLHVQGICDGWLQGEKAFSNLWYDLSCSLCIIFYSSLMWQWLDTENLLPCSS